MSAPILAIDLDGTLLAGSEIPESNAGALREAVSRGYIVVIATARWHQMAASLLEQMGIEGYVIACNGAHIYQPSHQLDLLDLRIDIELANAVMDRARTFGGLMTATLEHQVVVYSDTEETRTLPDYIQAVQGFPAFHGVGPRMMSYQGGDAFDRSTGDSSSGLSSIASLRAALTIDDSIGPSGQPVTIISAREATKGRALTVLCEHLGRSVEDVIAFGDSEGDLDLFAVAGTSVAMGQAPQRVRDAADFVTLSNVNAGVGAFIRKQWAGQ